MRKFMIEFLSKSESRGDKIYLMHNQTNQFTFILYGVEVRCDRP